MIDFAPLWKTMEQKNITQYKLLKQGIDNKTLDSLKKNKNITLTTMEKLCRILDCEPNDIVRFHDQSIGYVGSVSGKAKGIMEVQKRQCLTWISIAKQDIQVRHKFLKHA